MRFAFLSLTLVLLAGCGLKIGAIQSVDATEPSSAGTGTVVGRVQFIVDGKALEYHLFNRPIMRLFRFSDGQYYESPMVDGTGAFSWRLPEGEYEIAVLFGGMSPFGQPMLMRDRGVFWQVNGFTYPGYRLSATSGEIHYLGTLIVDVNSRKPKGVINFTGERVFESLNGMKVVDESETEPKWQPLKEQPDAGIRLLEPIPSRSETEREHGLHRAPPVVGEAK